MLNSNFKFKFLPYVMYSLLFFRKKVEQQKCRIDIFSFFCGQGKNVELEKILQFDIFVVKFEKGKNVELYILKGKNVELKF